MAEELHVNDVGVEIYLDIREIINGVEGLAFTAFHEQLLNFTVRTVRIRRPLTLDIITITDVATAVDPDDSVRKLLIKTGTQTGATLTGTGDFALPSTNIGLWIADVELAYGAWQGKTDALELFDLSGSVVAVV